MTIKLNFKKKKISKIFLMNLLIIVFIFVNSNCKNNSIIINNSFDKNKLSKSFYPVTGVSIYVSAPLSSYHYYNGDILYALVGTNVSIAVNVQQEGSWDPLNDTLLVSLSVNFGDGSTYTKTNSTTLIIINHVYTVPGTHTIEISASNEDGSASNSTQLVILPDKVPSFSYDINISTIYFFGDSIKNSSIYPNATFPRVVNFAFTGEPGNIPLTSIKFNFTYKDPYNDSLVTNHWYSHWEYDVSQTEFDNHWKNVEFSTSEIISYGFYHDVDLGYGNYENKTIQVYCNVTIIDWNGNESSWIESFNVIIVESPPPSIGVDLTSVYLILLNILIIGITSIIILKGKINTIRVR
ncbi:MAG: PKD domain-containing protein [Promethearchaeota archaeon]